jgi:hypothetical protein
VVVVWRKLGYAVHVALAYWMVKFKPANQKVKKSKYCCTLQSMQIRFQHSSQPRSQGFSLFVIGKSGKGPGTGRSHDFQHPDIVGVNKL